MKVNLKTAGVIAVSAALLFVPLKQLYKLVRKSIRPMGDRDATGTRKSTHLKRKPHTRHLAANKGLNWH